MPLTLRLAAATAEFLRVTMPGQWQDRATQAARATKNLNPRGTRPEMAASCDNLLVARPS